MVTFLLLGKNKEKRKSYLLEQSKKFTIDSLDIMTVDKQTIDKTQTIGIETIKYIKQKIFLTPLKSKQKMLVIEDAELLTPEAQNALLKLLEEPPDRTLIYLEAANKETFLPTILSRCQLIELQEEQTTLSADERKEYQSFLAILPSLSIGERLKKAEQLAKDKDLTIKWIEGMILILRDHLINEFCHPELVSVSHQKSTYQTLQLIQSFQQLHTLLKTTNVNLRFALESTLLNVI